MTKRMGTRGAERRVRKSMLTEWHKQASAALLRQAARDFVQAESLAISVGATRAKLIDAESRLYDEAREYAAAVKR